MSSQWLSYLSGVTLSPRLFKWIPLSFNVEPEDLIWLIGRGNWHITYFAKRDFGSRSESWWFGLRALPNRSWQEWPVVMSSGSSSITISSSLRTFLPMYLWRSSHILDNDLAWDELSQHWPQIQTELSELQYLMGGRIDPLLAFQRFLTDRQNRPRFDEDIETGETDIHFNEAEENQKRTDANYRMLGLLENESEYHAYLSFLKQVMETPTSIPSLPEKLGSWQDLAKMTAAMKAYTIWYETPLPHKEWLVWGGLNRAYAYDDCVSRDPKFLIQFDVSEAAHSVGFAEILFAHENSMPEEMITDSFWHVVRALQSPDYAGKEHMEVAAYLDSDLNEPLKCWDMLISSAYFSAVRLGKSLLPALEAALYVARERSWGDVVEVLSEALTLYRSSQNR